MPVSDLRTSTSWNDAKALFNEQARTYTGVLPRMHYWSGGATRWDSDGSSDTEGDKKLFIYDTGFFMIDISDSSTFGLVVTGFTDVEDYIISNGAAWSMHISRISAAEIGGQELHPCFDDTLGTHIGTLGTCGAGTNPTEAAALRFQTSLGAPEDPVTILSGDTFAVPILPESLVFWTAMEDYSWDNMLTRGQAFVDYVSASSPSLPDPSGITIDYEDHPPSVGWDSTGWQTLYSADPRFEFNTNEHADMTFGRNMSAMLDARYQILMDNIPYTINAENIILFETNSAAAHRFSSFTHAPTLSSTGRKKGAFSMYPGDVSRTLIHQLGNVGVEIFQSSTIGMHVFSAWISGGMTVLTPQDEPSIPVGSNLNIALTIAQCVGATKLMMSMGSEMVSVFNPNNNARHTYISVAVAYDEMQQYDDFITLGTNYIPPFDVNKAPVIDSVTLNHVLTSYYGKESDGTVIPDEVFINCRILNEQMLFCALRVNEKGTETTSSTHTVRAPDMQEVEVTASPEGTITVV